MAPRILFESKTVIPAYTEDEWHKLYAIPSLHDTSLTIDINKTMGFLYMTSDPNIICIEFLRGDYRYVQARYVSSFLDKSGLGHELMRKGVNPFMTRGF